ncbi:uncharacterized protein LOC129313485 isoform X3 [Prosopis cineraria]|uniref:uncharacterized protein LOC129313485 isoform X3 n=1 Tax=Prosopis cineraria TaxID=364024 RepID=UPI00240FE26F|nr:uncharacterized protein LOC129313485 isoform X3 [Prosopis cineraria]
MVTVSEGYSFVVLCSFSFSFLDYGRRGGQLLKFQEEVASCLKISVSSETDRWCSNRENIFQEKAKSSIGPLCHSRLMGLERRSVSVFNAAAPNPSQVLISTAAAVNEFWKINHSLPNITRSSEIFNSVWKPPDSGIVKINCDGAFSEAKKMAAIGIIACDSSGSFLKGWRKVVDADSGFLSELLACKKEVQLASEFNEARLL